ncbi:class I SAM-dependent methyltransferase [Carboxydothermus pertinax]|uniref:SAM-dependent methyltransferase n=1 Tax=Carboxydothermus pertinax TaxID=870242 RepID=A0A1L8CYM1_9THEO|nr:class I SAM-dependent methyltransferase [Carboxydothermus pertinax]GAV23964.1 SAM-dependent methyltransferase [Carboxydothermus pertinax]
MIRCPICGVATQISENFKKDYILCQNCFCFFINKSHIDDETENKRYFDNFYSLNFYNDKFKVMIGKIFKTIDYLLKFYNTYNFKNFEQKILRLINDKKILEIGFGEGDFLKKILDKGYNAYGLEISSSAVEKFKQKYPEYKERVFLGNIDTVNENYDVIIARAVVEHIDEQIAFFKNIKNKLNKKGLFIFSIPITNKAKRNIKYECDINFWFPYHRVIHSEDSIKLLANKVGFKIFYIHNYDYFDYRLMNLYLKNGIRDIAFYRNPYFKVNGFPNTNTFLLLCFKALFINSYTLYANIIFQNEN